MRHEKLIIALVGAALMWHGGDRVLAGPPLAIDDPGVLDPGGFEFILSAAAEKRDTGDSYDLPAFETTYGISANVQATVAIQRLVIDPDPGSSKSDWGEGAINVKWRFINTDVLQVALSPAYVFNLRDGAVDRGIADDLNDWIVPLDLEYDFGAWRLGGEASYTVTRGAKDTWGYGVAAYLPVRDNVDLMFEFYGDTDQDFDNSNSAVHLGAEIGLAAGTAILFSVGTGLADADGSDEFDLDVFLGLKVER